MHRLKNLVVFTLTLWGAAVQGSEQYSVFPLPVPPGVTITADDVLVPEAISTMGSSVLYSLRNRTTGTVAWYRYWGIYDRTEALGSLVVGFQHMELTSINEGLAVVGRAWNTDVSGALTAEAPLFARGGQPLARFGSLSGRLDCVIDGDDSYGQVHPLAPDFLTYATARAAFCIPSYSSDSFGYPLSSTVLKDRPALIEHFASRIVLDPTGGSYTNGNYIAGTYRATNDTLGFWRYLRPVGAAAVLDLVAPPAGVTSAYLANPATPHGNCGLTVTGKAAYRVGRDDDDALPTVSFYYDGATSVLIPSPAGVVRNVMRCGGVADVQGQVMAVGMAKNRVGNPTSGSDSNAVAWIWSPGDAQASLLQTRVPRPTTPRLGANAKACSIGDQKLGGQILCDGWDPLTTSTTPADRRILLLTPIPGIDLALSQTSINEAPTNSTTVEITPSQTAASQHWPLDITITFGGTAIKGLDFQLVDQIAAIQSQTSTSVVVRVGYNQLTTRFGIVGMDNTTVGANKTITMTVDLTGSGFHPTTAYRLGTRSSATVTINDNDMALPTITIAATDSTAAEPGADTGTLTVTRTGPTTAAMTVNFSVAGTATSGTDYTSIGTSAIIPAGSATKIITVTAIDDNITEAAETVIATLLANAAYTLGATNTATVTIVDDEGGGGSSGGGSTGGGGSSCGLGAIAAALMLMLFGLFARKT